MLYLYLDVKGIEGLSELLGKKLKEALEHAASDLTIMTHGKVLEQSQQQLHSTRQKFAEALSYHQVDADTWVITLNKSMVWLDQGMSEHSMLGDLLKSPKAKINKKGEKYLIVPFQHNKAPTQTTAAGKDLQSTIKKEFKKRGIAYGGVEVDSSGKPKTGLLHKLDISDPKKTGTGPGQGHGPLGDIRQGPTGIPLLQSVRVYQSAGGDGKVKKGIFTFRTAKEGQSGWVHPGVKAHYFMDNAFKWAVEQWEKTIKPEIVKEISSQIK